MRIKKGDNVLVMAGKDKGKKGKIVQVFPQLERVVVEGVNVMSKHLKTRRAGDKGQKIQFPSPLAASKVMLVCPKCGKPTRLGMKTLEGEGAKKVRVCKKCKEAIE
ncbi:50S ribosomal protein L24 [Candidatus Uhrbacteria bacterium]|nr:50S ribosomal protein L24 [Candidatus Uhrbacteria bacterium]